MKVLSVGAEGRCARRLMPAVVQKTATRQRGHADAAHRQEHGLDTPAMTTFYIVDGLEQRQREHERADKHQKMNGLTMHPQNLPDAEGREDDREDIRSEE